MKIAFLDVYGPASDQRKDPITIPHALAALGHEVILVSVNGPSGELHSLTVLSLEDWLTDVTRGRVPDVLIAITRFNQRITSILRRAKAAGCIVIVKGDTDGTVGFPLRPNYLRARPILANPLNIFRQLKWSIPVPSIIRTRLDQISISDATIVESPGAAANLSYFLYFWGCHKYVQKINAIPNPVAPDVALLVPPENKEKLIVSIGRWDDPVKGPTLLSETIARTLNVRQDYRFVVIGPESDAVWKKLEPRHREQVQSTGTLDFLSAHQHVRAASIMLTTSLIESFSFATAEALCTGCSVVVPPIESLIFLAGGGSYGTISSNFSAKAMTSSLLFEIEQDISGRRNCKEIACHWRSKLSPDIVGRIWDELISSLAQSSANQ